MKLQIITLEHDDDHVSTRDKLAWAKAPRALLVWPRRGRILTRRLDLALLQRQAMRQRTEIGLVTYDREVVGHAAALGIPVFESPDHLPEEAWRLPEAELPHAPPSRIPLADLPDIREWRERSSAPLIRLSPVARWAMVGIAVLAPLFLAFALLPRAEITLSPDREVQIMELDLVVDPEIDEPLPEGRIPAQAITIQVAGESRRPASGSALVPKISAAGTVVLTNLSTEALTIPAGTGLRASESGVRFLILEETQLPAGIGSTAEANIVAAEAGSAGNLPSGAIDSVEGSIGFLVSVTNPEPTRGGVSERSPAVTAWDRESLRLDLREQLLASAWGQLQGELSDDQALAEGSLTVIEAEREDFDRESGQPAVSVGLSMELTVQALAYRMSDVESVAGDLLSIEMPAGHLPVPGTIRLASLADGGQSNPPAQNPLSYRAQQHIVRKIDFGVVRRYARGLSRDRAVDRLTRSFSLSSPPRIALSPSWFPWLPWLPIRIDVAWAWESP